MIDEALVKELLDNYVYQKELLMEEAGCASQLNVERLHDLARPRIEKMAQVISDWDVTPAIIMSACFALAKKNKHPDGPMPNMLYSVKYLTRALSEYLQVPYEAVAQKRSLRVYLERCDYELKKMREDFERIGIDDLVTAASYPVEYRYVLALNRFDFEAANYMAPELLGVMSDSKKISTWMRHRGISYERVAAQFNKWLEKNK